MNTTRLAFLTLFEIRGSFRHHPRLDAWCWRAAASRQVVERFALVRSAPEAQPLRASSCGAAGRRLNRSPRGTVCRSRNGLTTRLSCSRTASRFPRWPPTASTTCCRVTRRWRRSWGCRTKRPPPIRRAAVRAGFCLASAGISGVTGQGVTVAVIDSGISYHPALAQKVIANVSFVSGDPQVSDAFGHGTHIAGTIAGVRRPRRA